MKKVLSVLLAALMMFAVMLPAFAEEAGSFTVDFTAPSDSLLRTNPKGEDIGEPYVFVKTENGKIAYKEDENGIYYHASDGNYYTRDQLIESSIAPDAKTYSPDVFDPSTRYVLTEGETFTFNVITNEAYNAATAVVYINGVVATKNSVGEYALYVDRDFSVSVKESVLQKTQFSVVLPSGDGYRVKTLQGQNYKAVSYGEDFSFRVKISKGYSDADLSVIATRGSTGFEEFLGEDADFLAKIMSPEPLVSNGVDSEGCRTYTLKTITTDCKINVSGVREVKKANVLTWIKKILKMILDVFGIDTSFLGLDVINLEYYTVNIDDSGLGEADIDYMLLTGVEDEFKMDQFNVMGGDSVTIEFVTYDPYIAGYSVDTGDFTNPDHLNVSWTPGNDGGTYKNVWTAKLNRSTGKTYFVTTFIIDNITASTNVSVSAD